MVSLETVSGLACPIYDVAMQYWMWGLLAGIVAGFAAGLVIYWGLIRNGIVDAPDVSD